MKSLLFFNFIKSSYTVHIYLKLSLQSQYILTSGILRERKMKMKKKFICLLLMTCAVFTNTAFASEIKATTAQEVEAETKTNTTNLYSEYTQSLSDGENTNLPITLDEVIEKALKNSTASKKISSNLKLYDKQSEFYGESYSSSFSYNNLSSLLNSQTAYKNAENSKKSTEESVKYSAKEVYSGIVTDERNLKVQAASLKLQDKELTLAKKKYSLGLISNDDLKDTQLSYDKAKESYKNLQDTLEVSYKTLNTLIGIDENERFSFSLPLEYEKLELPASIDTYISANVDSAASVKTAKLNLQSAKNSYNIRGLNEDSTEPYNYLSLTNSVNEADLSLKDAKDNVESNLRTLYNTIKTQESNIDIAKSELTRLKEDYGKEQTKFAQGTTSQIAVDEAQQKVIEKEYSILSQMYSHMLNVEKFKNMELF